jgi:hypothetical protein
MKIGHGAPSAPRKASTCNSERSTLPGESQSTGSKPTARMPGDQSFATTRQHDGGDMLIVLCLDPPNAHFAFSRF